MTPDDAFLQAIIEHPDDDTPRLIYADFLEEHGEQQRAEFIRVQLDLAKLPEGDGRRKALEVAERALLQQHGELWADPVLSLLSGMVTRHGFHRGFLDTLELEARGLVLHADTLFSLAPVQHLSVYLASRKIEQLAALPQLSHLSSLGVNPRTLDADGIRVLVASPWLTRLARLNLSHNDLGDRGAAVLAASPHLPGLTTLDLTMNQMGDDGALALVESAALAGLRSLRFYHNPINPCARRALRRRFGDGVQLSEGP